MKRLLAGITALVLCLAAASAALGEVHAKNTEKKGKVTETNWLNEKNKPAAGPEGYATVKYTYSKDTVTEMYFDTKGKAYKTAGGYYGRAVTKDGKGNITEIDYLNAEGKLTMNSRGYAMVTMAHKYGELASVNYRDNLKKLVVVPSLGYASMKAEFSYKSVTSRTYKDEKGNPVDNKDGYAVMKQKLDKKYYVIRIRYEHANGSAATGPDGWHLCVIGRDKKERITSIKYYDTKEKQIDRGAGYAWEEYEYEGDNIQKVTRRDLKDKAVEDSAGVATTVRELSNDRVVKERFLDKKGARVNNADGVAEIVYSYDKKGRIEKVSYRDAAGNPVICNAGYAGYKDKFDDDGAVLSRTFLGTDGNETVAAGGYSRIEYTYDDTKRLTSTRYLDTDGRQVRAE